jgi:hypothetical protein
MLGRHLIRLPGSRAGPASHESAIHIERNLVHLPEIDDDSAIATGKSGLRMSTAPDGNGDTARAREVQHAYDITGSATTGYQKRMTVIGTIVSSSQLVEFRMLGVNDLTGNSCLQGGKVERC